MSALRPQAAALLQAVIAISTDLDLLSVLTRIVEAATSLTGARYGALGVIGADGSIEDFVTTGLDEPQRAAIGDLPTGHGILGLLIEHPEPLRLGSLHEHPESAGFPANHPQMGSFLGVPIRIRGTVFGNLYLTEKTPGLSFTEEDEVLVQGLASAAGFVIENARAYGLSERRRQLLEATAELTDHLQPPAEPQDAQRLVTTRARTLARASATALVLLSPELRIAATDGIDADAVEPLLEQIQELVTHSPSDFAVPDFTGLDGQPGMALRVPAHLSDPGILLVFCRGPVEPTERELMAAYADQAGLALDRAQAVRDREQLAVVSERDRIARDLHDAVMQRLFSTGLQLQALRASALTTEDKERVDQAVASLDETIKQIRSTIFALRSSDT